MTGDTVGFEDSIWSDIRSAVFSSDYFEGSSLSDHDLAEITNRRLLGILLEHFKKTRGPGVPFGEFQCPNCGRDTRIDCQCF
jgi:hypothetical protein